MESIILFSMVLILLFIGLPVGISLGLSSILFITFFSHDSLSSVAISLFGVGQHYTLLAIPFFIIASSYMSTGGVAKRLINFAIASVGHFRGGLAMASVLACMMFAALSGSSPATVVAIGTIAIAGMRQVGYSKEFASGIIANAGTLGILIPPSIVMVVYAASVDVSVGRMFLAGVIPGLMAGGMLMLAIYVVARIKKLPAEEWKGFGNLIRGGKDAGWGLFLVVIIMGGIYGGVFTPTEAAVVAAVYSMFIALFVYRDMGPLKGKTWTNDDDTTHARVGFNGMVYGVSFFLVWEIMSFFALSDNETITGGDRAIWGLIMSALLAVFYVYKRSSKLEESISACFLAGLPIWGRNLSMMLRGFFPSLFGEESRKVMLEGTKTTVMLMFIIANALLFAHTLSAERIPQMITEWMLGVGFNWFTFLVAVNILLLIGGQFMEPSGLLVIVAPVVFPIAMELGVDPIHLGIIMVVNMEIGMITPPIGLNLFVTSGITGMSLARVVKAAMPFVLVLMVFLVLVTYIPALSTALPYSIMGPEIVQ
ncbi:TRAP transporter large permease [Marinomonas posidonica]|uniref:TRAP transporter large permease protein n=1 Tax=Marinomonas posidonica (strain CECT 7376 / NCIMB 14433 / IVIA-Po-181) TaxID=491952 RepID=F6D098_MARPP|nr:TRAP transporter large permease subunit [Marinomonas posidonica]AEF55922.1 TRAP dicarboxylate transporter, DctM subunit [Marinomonas posidonica IVIA-Po-181]